MKDGGTDRHVFFYSLNINNMKKTVTLRTALAALLMAVGFQGAWADEQPTPVYFNDFSSAEGLTIVGNGVFEDDADPRFGQVFHNDPSLTLALRTNYLQLPEDVLSHSVESKEMTIGFWVNAASAGALNNYTYAPLFTAYGSGPNTENGMPMMALQSRGPIQINCSGWSDFTGENHVDGKVNIYHQNAWEAGSADYNFVRNWLDDGAWHLYVVTFTSTEAIQYLDGEITNHWTFDPSVDGQKITGLFSNGSDLKYISLGGNQAWSWGDPDAAFCFDDFAVYDKALTADQIKQVINEKLATTATFDFTSENIRENIGTALTDTKGYIYNETFTANDVTLQVTGGSAPSRIYVDANRGQNLVTYPQYATLTFKAPEDYAITKIEFTAAGNSNINKFEASSGTIEGMVWTGNAEGVRFAQGGTSYLANAIVTLADKDETTTALPAIEYAECANIAAFNALEAGSYAKVTLTDAEVIGKSADGYSTVWIQDATGGCWIQYTSLNDKLNEGTKVNGTVYVVNRLTAGNTQMKEAEATLDSELTAADISDYTIVEGTLDEVNVAANLNKLVKISGATLEETSATAGKLTQSETTIDVNNGSETANQQLHKIADWAKDTKLENVTVVAILVAKSATANQLLPLSIEDGITDAITTVSATATASTVYSLQGQRRSQLQKGVNIVNGKKVVMK